VSEHRIHQRCACASELASSARFERGADAQSFVLAGTARVYERPRPFVIEHIALELRIDHPNKSLGGNAELHIKRVAEGADELRLDAVGFDISAVHLKAAGKKDSWRPAKHSYDGETLALSVAPQLGPFVVRVQYSASPRRGMYFLEPDDIVKDRPRQVWTQCQDEDARHIFPCHDKPHIKQTMDIRVHVEPGWFALSNGDLVSGKQAQKKGEFHYRMAQAQPSYLFTVVAGQFSALEDKVGELPVTYYVPPGREDDGWRTFARTPAMIRLFAKVTGVPYPWTKYAQVVVHDFIFGGMENTGATTMYEHILLDERAALDVSSDDLIAHELAHQWFGDLVTCRDWSHAWLNEGFATFMEHVWRDHHLGTDEYHHGLVVDLRAYLSEASGRYRRPVVCQDYEAPIDVFDRHLYEKGALFLHSLRLELGHDVFWRGVRGYLQAHAGGVVETRDLLRAMEDVSGESLEQFFEQGLLRAAHPRLDVTVSYESGALTVVVTQTVDDGGAPFSFDLEIDVAHAQGKKPVREVRRVTQLRHTFAFAVHERPRFVVIDPELRIIGRVNEKVPADMLRNQLLEAPSARGRVLAAEALGRKDDPTTIRALGEALANPRLFWGARAAAATALGSIRSPAAYGQLSKALRTKHPKVRRAVAKALGNYRTAEAAKALTRVAHDDVSYQVAASACRALGETRQPGAFESLVELLDRPAWADTLRGGAIEGLAQLRDRRAVEHVRAATRYGVPERGRRAAVAVLPSMSTSRKTRETLEEVLDDGNPHLRVSAAMALGELGDTKARPALRQLLERDLDGRVRRRVREVLRDLTGSGRRETRQLREDLDQLRRSNQELAARLSKLEETVVAERRHKKRP
jgi:aminopeptidase N